MNCSRLLSVVATCLAASLTMSAAEGLLAYDGFAYPAGSLANNSGGTGWAGAWTDGFNGIGAESLVSKIGETPAVTGGQAQIVSQDWASHRILATKIGDKAGTWYVSFLVANEAAVTAEHYILLTIGTGDATFGFGKDWMDGSWSLRTPKKVGSNVSCATKDAVFVVLKAVYADGAATDKVQAYFDPDLANEPKIADIEMAGVDLPVGERLSLTSKKAAAFDEIRIGTTWASVCPAK